MQKPKQILILGAGFAGMNLAHSLAEKYDSSAEIQISLIDRHDYHLFTPLLYKVAASEEEFTGIKNAGEGIRVPLKEAFGNTKVKVITGSVTLIDLAGKKVELDSRKAVDYDYLFLALGSLADFLGVPGAEKYALPFKNLADALRIRNAVEFAVQENRTDVRKKNLRIMVVGGGQAGVSLSAELSKALGFIAWKNQYPKEKIKLEITEAADRLLPGFTESLSRAAENRLSELGVTVRTGSVVGSVEDGFVNFLNGERLSFDVLVWCAGTKANEVRFVQQVEKDHKGRLKVNDFFQLHEQDNVFALGDMAAFVDKKGKLASACAGTAWQEAEFLASNLALVLKNRRPKGFNPSKQAAVANVGGKWAVRSGSGFVETGFLAFVIEKLSQIKYFKSFLGWQRAFKWAWAQIAG